MALISLNDLYDKWKKVSDWVTGVDAVSAPKVTVTGSNPTDAKTPGNGDTNALIAGFNGANWDRWRNNAEGTLLASAARTAHTNTPTQTNHNARGVMLTLHVTGNPGGAETLKVRIAAFGGQGTGAKYIVDFPNIPAATNDAYVYYIYPNVTETIATSQVEVQSLPLPRTWYARVEHSGAGSWTYSLGYSLIL